MILKVSRACGNPFGLLFDSFKSLFVNKAEFERQFQLGDCFIERSTGHVEEMNEFLPVLATGSLSNVRHYGNRCPAKLRNQCVFLFLRKS